MLPSGKKSWLTNRRISELQCTSNMTPCTGKSSLKWDQQIWWGCSLGSFYHWQSWCSSCTLCWWSAGHGCATEAGSLCWQHHSRTWELSYPSICGFSYVNKQPSALGSQSTSSGSPYVQHWGLWHSSQILIPHVHHWHQTQKVWSFIWQCIWWPMQLEGSHQNQERAHCQWQPQIQCQCRISSLSHWVWHHSHQRWQRPRAPHKHQGCQEWQTWPHPQTQQS